jgi:hypothetical protein
LTGSTLGVKYINGLTIWGIIYEWTQKRLRL